MELPLEKTKKNTTRGKAGKPFIFGNELKMQTLTRSVSSLCRLSTLTTSLFISQCVVTCEWSSAREECSNARE